MDWNLTWATIFGLSFMFSMTTLGATLVCFCRKALSPLLRTISMAGAGGLMLSASCFGLIAPSFQEAKDLNPPYPYWVPALVGFVLGVACIFLLGLVIPKCTNADEGLLEMHRHPEHGVIESDEEIANRYHRGFRLFLAVLLHNIPEGVAAGLAFGVAKNKPPEERAQAIGAAVGLALGIGFQDIPEGLAVALPIREITGSTCRGFVYGMLSGVSEPVFGVVAMYVATTMKGINPWGLAFAGGAMTFVVVDDLLPEAWHENYPRTATFSALAGFLLMMILDVVIG